MKEYFEKTYSSGPKEFSKHLEKAVKDNRKMFIVTANPETFMIASRDKDFEKIILDKKTTVIPDGIGIVKAANMLGFNWKERIPGIDIAYDLLRIANDLSKSIYLFGANEEVNRQLESVIHNQYPNIIVAGRKNGYQEDKDAVFEEIKKTSPDIVLVALGIPQQEKLIYRHLSDFQKGIFVGVGGSFDVISGFKKRAPKVFRKMNLEWFYRIVKEPKRLKRFYNNNVKFMVEVRKEK